MKYIFYQNSTDCFICALKPVLQIGITLTFIAQSKCPHSNRVKKPIVQENLPRTLLAILWISILILDVFVMIFQILCSNELPKTTLSHYIVCLPVFINTIALSLSFISKNRVHLHYTNGLIEIIHKRKMFGMEAILDNIFNNSHLYLLVSILSFGSYH